MTHRTGRSIGRLAGTFEGIARAGKLDNIRTLSQYGQKTNFMEKKPKVW
jgi:hypothetical protein